jgi:hypothetical protein
MRAEQSSAQAHPVSDACEKEKPGSSILQESHAKDDAQLVCHPSKCEGADETGRDLTGSDTCSYSPQSRKSSMQGILSKSWLETLNAPMKPREAAASLQARHKRSPW